jgi:AbrB family looped-hinge helix DNA binding protein
MSAETKISAKGQVVIPKALRDRLHWSEGDQLEAIETAGGVLLRRKGRARRSISVHEFMAEMPRHEGAPATLEEMDEAIDRAMAERWAEKEPRSR